MLFRDLSRDPGQRDERVSLVEADDSHALGISADLADIAGANALNLAAGRDHDHFIVVGHRHDVHDFAVAVGRADVAQALAAALLPAVALIPRIAGGGFLAFFALG